MLSFFLCAVTLFSFVYFFFFFVFFTPFYYCPFYLVTITIQDNIPKPNNELKYLLYIHLELKYLFKIMCHFVCPFSGIYFYFRIVLYIKEKCMKILRTNGDNIIHIYIDTYI